MADKNVNIIFKGNLQGISSAVTGLETRFKRLGSAINSATSGLTSKITGLVSGAMILKLSKDMIDLDKSVRSFGRDASMSAAQMVAMRNNALTMSMQTGASTESIIALGQGMYSSGKNMDFVNKNLTLGTKIMQATGASATDVGDSLSDINEELGLTGAGLETFIDKMISFGKQAGVESKFAEMLTGGNMKKMLRQAKAALGSKAGPQELGKYITTQMFVGADVNLQKSYKSLMSAKTWKKLSAIKPGLKKTDVMDIGDAVKLIMSTAPDRATAMARMVDVFSNQGIALAKLYDEQDAYNKALQASGNLQGDAKTQSESLEASMNRLSAVAKRLAVDFLLPALQKFSEWIQRSAGGDTERLIKQLGGLVQVFLALGGAVAAIKVGSALGQFAGIMGGGKGGAAAGMAGIGGRGSTPALPLYVTFAGAGMGTGAAGAGAMGGAAAAGGSMMGKVLGGAGKLMGAAMIAIVAEELIDGMSKAILGKGYATAIVDLFTGGKASAAEKAGMNVATKDSPEVTATRNRMRATAAREKGQSTFMNVAGQVVSVSLELDGQTLAGALKNKRTISRGDQTPNMKGAKE